LTLGTPSDEVAGAIATARRLAGMSTREFAAAICARLHRPSLHASTVSKWEHGVVTPPADVLVSAALVADVPIQVLFDDVPGGSAAVDRVRELEERMNALTHRVDRLSERRAAAPRPWRRQG
jgi:transcriptional regulator with XRE-family HTH domain